MFNQNWAFAHTMRNLRCALRLIFSGLRSLRCAKQFAFSQFAL